MKKLLLIKAKLCKYETMNYYNSLIQIDLWKIILLKYYRYQTFRRRSIQKISVYQRLKTICIEIESHLQMKRNREHEITKLNFQQ